MYDFSAHGAENIFRIHMCKHANAMREHGRRSCAQRLNAWRCRHKRAMPAAETRRDTRHQSLLVWQGFLFLSTCDVHGERAYCAADCVYISCSFIKIKTQPVYHYIQHTHTLTQITRDPVCLPLNSFRVCVARMLCKPP